MEQKKVKRALLLGTKGMVPSLGKFDGTQGKDKGSGTSIIIQIKN
jgi:hypothetical protein